MNHEFFEALSLLEKEKGIPAEYLIEKIQNAISIAIKRDLGAEDNIVEIDPVTERFYVAVRKTVVEDVEDPALEISMVDALKLDRKVELGSMVQIPLETKQFGRIAAQSAKHVIRQGIREAEKGQLLQEYQSRQHDIVSASVLKLDPKRGSATLEIAGSEAILPKSEQVPTEELVEGKKIKVYVVDVLSTEKGPRLMISRTHPGLVKRLFEMNVPEIYDGTVEIKAISREAIVEELGGEKIDVVKYSEDPAEFIAAALSPATVLSVEENADAPKSCRVTVPDHQLSLAIGNKGQNARLAAKLTGWKIDIRPESGFYGEDEETPASQEETADEE